MPKGNPEGYLKKPKEVEKKLKKASVPPKAKTTLDLEKKLEERRKKAKKDGYLSKIDGN